MPASARAGIHARRSDSWVRRPASMVTSPFPPEGWSSNRRNRQFDGEDGFYLTERTVTIRPSPFRTRARQLALAHWLAPVHRPVAGWVTHTR